MLSYDEKAFGIQECELNLVELYPADNERHDFLVRLDEFLKSDSYNERIFSLH
jgi:hypothetical protein